jgi:hypothetical protein
LSNTALSTENFIVLTPRSYFGDLSRDRMGRGGEPPVKSCPGDKPAESARQMARIRFLIPAWIGPEKRLIDARNNEVTASRQPLQKPGFCGRWWLSASGFQHAPE